IGAGHAGDLAAGPEREKNGRELEGIRMVKRKALTAVLAEQQLPLANATPPLAPAKALTCTQSQRGFGWALAAEQSLKAYKISHCSPAYPLAHQPFTAEEH